MYQRKKIEGTVNILKSVSIVKSIIHLQLSTVDFVSGHGNRVYLVAFYNEMKVSPSMKYLYPFLKLTGIQLNLLRFFGPSHED